MYKDLQMLGTSWDVNEGWQVCIPFGKGIRGSVQFCQPLHEIKDW
jgi:hypothetical protein